MSLMNCVRNVSLLLSAAGLCAVAQAMAPAKDSDQLVSNFSVTDSTTVPGKTLKSGNYSIHVVDHLSDRLILQIEDAKGKVQTTFLALDNQALRNGSVVGPVAWKTGPEKTTALRGFTFPGGGAVEFVYPKDDAVAIATVNDSKVPAIDPESEGRVSANHLSKDDLQMVTLWTLSPTRVGPENHTQPAIQAERYQAPAASVEAASNRSAAASAPARLTAQSSQVVSPQIAPRAHARRTAPAATPEVAALRRPAGIASLPHTASDFPLFLLGGLFALLFAGLLRVFRIGVREA
jgi:hypothetical protein